MSRSLFECQPCDRKFTSDEALQSHLQHSSRHFWCNPCNRVFNSQQGLESHLSTSKAHKQCYTCNRGFISAGALQSHMNTVLHRYALADSTGTQIPDTQKPYTQKPNPKEPNPQKPSTALQAPHFCTKCNISFKEPFQLREVSVQI